VKQTRQQGSAASAAPAAAPATPPPAPRAAATLARAIAAERQEPRPMETILGELEAALPEEQALLRFLAAKDRAHRHTFYVKSERLWYRRLGFRVMRPLFVVALLAATGFSLQRVVDPTLAFACFVAGMVALYLAIQFWSLRGMRQDEDKLQAVEREYRRELEEMADGLERR
jgi:hypothetical protein